MKMNLKKIFHSLSVLTIGNLFGTYCYIKIKKNSSNKLNIIFDLDETIIHTDKKNNFDNYNHSNILKEDIDEVVQMDGLKQTIRKIWIRPFVKIFIPIISEFNNIYLFTKATKPYADLILEKCNLNKYFIDKKYRDDCKGCCKDLSKFNINLEKSILIDDKLSNNCPGQKIYHIPRFNYYVKNDFEIIKLFGFILWINIKHDFNTIIKINK